MPARYCSLPIAPCLLPLVFSLLPLFLTAQPTTDENRRNATAVRTELPPKLDGELNDACWQNAPVMSDFITNSPVFGKPACEKAEVRIVYTNEAIYIGAYLYQDGAKVRTDLSKRDAGSTADQFHVGLDTYLDRQNAFRFEISAGGVQRDLKMSPNNVDVSWDAVWDARVKVHADGWVVEMEIPFSAIRFPKKSEQLWGLQFARQIQYANEFSSWSPVDPNGGGAMPQWGNLHGLKDIDAPLRLAFSPYVAASVQRSPVNIDPVEFANSRTLNGGMDVKWGLSESFTLDATLVPNFGEVQSDNKVRNLSPFEVQYEERRQFFTEGTELFSKAGIFYSRRIGDTPPGFFDAASGLQENEVLKKNPFQTPLYNATKFSGRTRSKLGIGILNAVAAPAKAVIRNESTGAEREFRTSELTNYNVLVFDQALKNNSSVSFINTNVLREGQARDANVSALTFNLRDKNNRYEVFGENRLSQVWATPGAAASTGYGLRYGLSKVSGNWGWTGVYAQMDDRFDQRDLGLFRRNNYRALYGQLRYGNYSQRGNILYSYAEFSAENTWLYKPQRWEALELIGYGEFQNTSRHTFSMFALSRPLWYYDYFEPRVWGKKYYHAPWGFIEPAWTSDTRKRLFATVVATFGESPIPNDPYIGLSVRPTWVASNHLRLTPVFRLSKDHSNFGAVNWDDPENVIFGRRDITTFDNSLAAEYLFNPRMNATIRARYYWLKLYYHQYLRLEDDGTFTPSDWPGSADENFNQFNVDFVYTWQFAPGSFLNVIWKDAVFQGDGMRGDHYFDNFRKTMRAPQDNTLTVKLIYWLDAGRWGRA